MNNDLTSKVIQDTLEKGGVTLDLRAEIFVEPVDTWYYPKYPDLTKIVSPEEFPEALGSFIQENQNLLNKEECYLGTWLNPESQKVYLDVTTEKTSLEEALNDARKISGERGRKIVTIYNPVLKQTRYVWEGVRT